MTELPTETIIATPDADNLLEKYINSDEAEETLVEIDESFIAEMEDAEYL